MKLPISWLRDWIEFDAPAERLGDVLTRRGFYVEGIEQRGVSYPGVVVARVLEGRPSGRAGGAGIGARRAGSPTGFARPPRGCASAWCGSAAPTGSAWWALRVSWRRDWARAGPPPGSSGSRAAGARRARRSR